MNCPDCKTSRVARVGSGLGLWLRRLARKNLYVCHVCRTYWEAADLDPAAPIVPRVRIVKKGHPGS